MRHNYLRHKCLRIWGEIAKINVAKALKIWLNAKIYVVKSNVHMPKLPQNLSSYISGISSL